MLNIIILIVGVLLIIAGIAVIGTARSKYEKELDEYEDREHGGDDKKPVYKMPKVSVILILVGLAVIFLSFSVTTIPSGYTGVWVKFGQVDDKTAQNGINFKIPVIESIKKVNNKQQDITFNGQTWSETADRTAIYYDGITVTYQIAKDKSAWIYANVQNYKDKLVTQPLVESAIKEGSKTLSDTDATDRGKIELLSMQNIQKSLDGKYGEGTVIINKVVIASADFDDSYNAAIAEKQNAQLAYEKQQIENKKAVEQAKAEADAKVKKAEGKAESKKISAEAEAEAIKIRAAAQAEANKELSQSITQELIDMELAKARQEHGWVTVQGADTIIKE